MWPFVLKINLDSDIVSIQMVSHFEDNQTKLFGKESEDYPQYLA